MPRSPLFWKFLLIIVVVGAAAWAAFPPEERINLGLDLRGGAHILMQVETDATLQWEMEAMQSAIGQGLADRDISYGAVLVTAPTTMEIRGADPARRDDVRELLDLWLAQWEVNSLGAGDFRITMPSQRQSQLAVEAIETTKQILDERINGLGVAGSMVQKQGIAGDRILILLPGVEDPERVKDLIGDTQLLEWKEVTYPPVAGDNPCGSSWSPPATRELLLQQFGGAIPDDTELYAQDIPQLDGTTVTILWPLKRISVVRGTDLVDARPDMDEWNTSQISFTLSPEAGRRFEDVTRRQVGCIMPIVLGTVDSKRVISTPVIQSVIPGGRGRITGTYGPQEAQDFALQLRSGAIPTDLNIIEERTLGRSLGHDSIRAGLTSGLAGFLGVMLFLLIYYRLAGVNAVVALTLNILLVFGTLGALPFLFAGAQATLTLPGIAGLILTVGMAVDSNVLIFERIREELRLGKTVRSAVDQGFGKAFMTILDCNVTTLVSAFFLFSYGTGPVKGFAVTLTIGLLASMFTAVFVSRQLFELVLTIRGRAETLSI